MTTWGRSCLPKPPHASFKHNPDKRSIRARHAASTRRRLYVAPTVACASTAVAGCLRSHPDSSSGRGMADVAADRTGPQPCQAAESGRPRKHCRSHHGGVATEAVGTEQPGGGVIGRVQRAARRSIRFSSLGSGTQSKTTLPGRCRTSFTETTQTRHPRRTQRV